MSGYQNPALNSSHSSQDTLDRQVRQYPAPGSSEWQAQTGTYQPRSRIVVSFTQLKAEIGGIRAHFTTNPAYTLPSQGAMNIQMIQNFWSEANHEDMSHLRQDCGHNDATLSSTRHKSGCLGAACQAGFEEHSADERCKQKCPEDAIWISATTQ